jgi:hypothetical protein
MSPIPKEAQPSITVVRTWIGQQATGATALLLETQEMGTIALPLSLEGIELLRQDLAKAEVLLRRGTGSA